jgi:hypothetical protein
VQLYRRGTSMQHGDNRPLDAFEFFDFQSSSLPDHYSLDWDSDGLADVELRDLDGNGIPDQFSIDVDSNASADLTIETRRGLLPDSIKIDLNADGRFDVSAFDTDANLWPDIVAADLAGDGRHETVVPVSLNGLLNHLTGAVEPIASWGEIEAGMSAVPTTTTPEPLAMAPSIDPAGPVIENVADAWDEQWHVQTHSDTCAICCQEFVIEGLLGIDVNEDELIKIATDLGVYEYGTRADSIGSLLSHFGIESNLSFDNTLEQLTAAVNSGHGVIVGVDADELWNVPDSWEDILNVPGSGATHAVQVIGLQAGVGDQLCVVLNDPGIPDGRGCVVPIDKFHSAWRDSHGLMCVTTRTIQA